MITSGKSGLFLILFFSNYFFKVFTVQTCNYLNICKNEGEQCIETTDSKKHGFYGM
jgi:hypothetical protein